MKYSGERYIPESIKSAVISFEHWHRYHFAAQLVAGKDVLDVACGAGYGSHLLAVRGSKSVVGLDISEETVEYAQQHYQAPKLSYRQGDVCRLPFEDNSFDVITSFETIEHISEEQQHQSMREFKRVLKPGGFLIISTPNLDSALYKDVENEFHIKEFRSSEFEKFLGNYFPRSTILGQSFLSASIIADKEVTAINKVLSVQSQNFSSPVLFSTPNAKFSIAVCYSEDFSDEDRRRIECSVFVDEQNSFFSEYEDYISSLKSHILEKENVIQNTNDYAQSIEKEKVHLEKHLSDKERVVKESKEYASSLLIENEKISEKCNEYQQTVESLQKKLEALKNEAIESGNIRHTLSEKISALGDEISKKDIAYEELHNALIDKESELKDTQEILAKETEKMSEAYSSLKKAFDEVISNNNANLVESKISDKVKAADALQALCAEKEIELIETQKILTDETEKMSKAYKDLRAAYDQKSSDLNVIFKDSQKEIDSLRNALQLKNDEAESLKSHYIEEREKTLEAYASLKAAFESKSQHEEKLIVLVSEKERELSLLRRELNRVLEEHERYVSHVESTSVDSKES